jgi:hypothetical protein
MSRLRKILLLKIKKKQKICDLGSLSKPLLRETKYSVKNWQIRKRKKSGKKN